MIRLIFFIFISHFFSSQAIPCWNNLKYNSSTSAKFILAMGANTGDLKNTNHDAENFLNVIQQRFKVPNSNVCLIKNVRHWQFKSSLKTLAKIVDSKDQVFIYFSGHGTQVPDNNTDEQNCVDEALIPFDFKGKRYQAISDDQFVYWVNKINTNNIISVIDTCFSGGMFRGDKMCQNAKSKFWLMDYISSLLPKKTCQVKPLKNRLKGVLYAATKESQTAWELAEGGFFTLGFVKNIQAYPNKTLDSIFEITANEIKLESSKCDIQQEPQRWSSE
jgi:hypothetical protein